MNIAAWGANDKGQLGVGDKALRKDLDSRVLIDVELRSISSGGFHNVAIANDDQVYVWGYNFYNQLGLDDNEDRLKPTAIDQTKAIQTGAGQLHSLILTCNLK
jgi:alpha-tubulin suppressor-like RCC1 family protein